MSDKYGVDQDPYCYPGTNTLINLFDIQDEATLERAERKLTEFAFFINLPKNRLIEKVAEFYTDVNVLHPFRDGNGRVQRILFEHLILNCGYSISWQQVSRQEWIYANIEGFNGRNSAMAKIFARCIGDEISD